MDLDSGQTSEPDTGPVTDQGVGQDAGQGMDQSVDQDAGQGLDQGAAQDASQNENEDAGHVADQGGHDSADQNAPPQLDAAASPFPVIVSDWFQPSGYMGDGRDGLIEVTPCEMRAPNAAGTCHRFIWTAGTQGWAGTYWQFPDGNWGTVAGFEMPPGATGVRFSAWGDTGDEVVSFGSGMMDVDGYDVSLSNVQLTTTPMEYTVSLADTEYGLVVGGFRWTSTQSAERIIFSVDNIRWVDDAQ